MGSWISMSLISTPAINRSKSKSLCTLAAAQPKAVYAASFITTSTPILIARVREVQQRLGKFLVVREQIDQQSLRARAHRPLPRVAFAAFLGFPFLRVFFPSFEVRLPKHEQLADDYSGRCRTGNPW